MRNYKMIDRYLNELAQDIYPQPSGHDEHPALAKVIIDTWMSRLTSCHSVLDLGCGEGFCQPFFEEWNVAYRGVCLGEDYIVAKEAGRNVQKMDFHFLEFEDKSYDLLFARHSLEHSPMPLLALMEWARVSRQWLGLVMPAPEHYTYRGLNHYSVMNMEQIANLTERAGWRMIWEDNYIENEIPIEYRLMLEKK